MVQETYKGNSNAFPGQIKEHYVEQMELKQFWEESGFETKWVDDVSEARKDMINFHAKLMVGNSAPQITATLTTATKSLSTMKFSELQDLVKTYSTEMNAFFKSGGTQVASKEALQAYKELATRMLNGTGGAYQRVTETAAKLHTERIEMINKALQQLK